MKNILYIILTFFLIACKGDAELAMERGIQYYEWEKIEKAILEFKYVIHKFSPKRDKLNYEQIKILSRAHHNLAIAYAKKTWYKDAYIEAKVAFELIPTEDNRKVMELINQKNQTEKQNLEKN